MDANQEEASRVLLNTSVNAPTIQTMRLDHEY